MKRYRRVWPLVCLCVFAFMPEWALAGSSYPNRPITIIVPSTAGGGTDIAARVLAPMMEKELGVSVQVVNKPGAGHQVGITEIARAKPDGYTIGYVILPTAFNTYLDPRRKAIYDRNSFVPLTVQYDLAYCMAVHKDGPYKTLSDLIAAAKAKPDTVKLGTTGLGATAHLAALKFQKVANVKFALVHFDGSAPQVTALVGQHIDLLLTGQAEVLPHYKGGTFLVPALLQTESSPDFPGVKTTAELGYPFTQSALSIISGPKGLPQEVVDVLASAMKKVITSDNHQQKMMQVGFPPVRYQTPQEAAKLWADNEAELRPFIEELSKTN